MSIPLDRLYHYIESVAQDVYGDTVIYHFYPHGSKKIENLHALQNYYIGNFLKHPLIFCNDQEPLNFDLYQGVDAQKDALLAIQHHLNWPESHWNFFINRPEMWIRPNLQTAELLNIYDHCIIMHSELNSQDVSKYSAHNFVPVYYWSHALISLDWYRYAQHLPICKKNVKYDFLIYNRAWTGTREYRLKFADLLVEYNLLNKSNTSVSFTCDNINYSNHMFKNNKFTPNHTLENFFKPNNTTPCYSANFDVADYQSANIEVVLETLFDDARIHLTEKILRPIALGQPFILVSTPGSLKYLKKYGFKTFDSIINESYDNIIDPVERLNSIMATMTEVSNWDNLTKTTNIAKMHEIAEYNKNYFFSDTFFNLITEELKNNLRVGLDQIELLNTGEKFFKFRKIQFEHLNLKNMLKQLEKENIGLCNIQFALKKARQYKNRNNKY